MDFNCEKCGEWIKKNKKFETCDLNILTSKDSEKIILEGKIKNLHNFSNDTFVQYWAASPIDRKKSKTFIPFANKNIAFFNSPNVGRSLIGKNGSFRITIKYPNSYYTNMGSIENPPNIQFFFTDNLKQSKIVTVVFDEKAQNINIRNPNYIFKRFTK